MRIDLLLDMKNPFGEGPLWDPDTERLYWIDCLDGRVFRTTAAGGELRAWDVPSRIGSMALRRGGGAVVALENGFNFLDFDTGEVTPIVDPEPELATNRFNDGKVDPRGRFVAGTMDLAERSPAGSLYSLAPDLTVSRLDTGIICSSGPCWSPDGTRLYFADTWGTDIWVYDYDLDTGAASNRRSFVTLAKGAPDGSTVDAEGCLWNVLVYEGQIVRYTPEGRVDRVIDMPVKKVTSVMFGGPRLDVLYVTSMAKPPLPHLPGDDVMRGSLFAIRDLGVTGLPEPKFAG